MRAASQAGHKRRKRMPAAGPAFAPAGFSAPALAGCDQPSGEKMPRS